MDCRVEYDDNVDKEQNINGVIDACPRLAKFLNQSDLHRSDEARGEKDKRNQHVPIKLHPVWRQDHPPPGAALGLIQRLLLRIRAIFTAVHFVLVRFLLLQEETLHDSRQLNLFHLLLVCLRIGMLRVQRVLFIEAYVGHRLSFLFGHAGAEKCF